MQGEIVNRVANSKLVTIDLDSLYPKGERILLDISQWLFQGLIVREKDFRTSLKEQDWQEYQDKYVVLYCSTDAIIPGWAYLLITTYLQPYAKLSIKGSLQDLDNILLTEIINSLDLDLYKDKPVIITGCSKNPIPETSYLQLIQRIMPVANSILYGEACSSVPLYKKARS